MIACLCSHDPIFGRGHQQNVTLNLPPLHLIGTTPAAADADCEAGHGRQICQRSLSELEEGCLVEFLGRRFSPLFARPNTLLYGDFDPHNITSRLYPEYKKLDVAHWVRPSGCVLYRYGNLFPNSPMRSHDCILAFRTMSGLFLSRLHSMAYFYPIPFSRQSLAGSTPLRSLMMST